MKRRSNRSAGASCRGCAGGPPHAARDLVDTEDLVQEVLAGAIDQRSTELRLAAALGRPLPFPGYLGPEQTVASFGECDRRVDVFALGALLYELLAGRAPLAEIGGAGGGLTATIQAIRQDVPIPPSERLQSLEGEVVRTLARQRRCEATALVAVLQGELDQIATKALRKKAADRIQSAATLATAIGRLKRPGLA